MYKKIGEKILELFDRNIQGKFSYLPSCMNQMTVRTIGHVVLIDSGVHSNMFNVIYCNGEAEKASVQAAEDYFKFKKLPYAFWIGFEHEPIWLEEELKALGYISDETEWAMLCDLDKQKPPLINPDFEIREVQDSAGIQDVIDVITTILPRDEHSAIRTFYEQSAPILLSESCFLTFFVGYVKGNPVSLSSLFCDQEIASLFDVIVLPEMRGRGLGTAMTLKAMRHAQEQCFHQCILTATNDAKYLYQKLGFLHLKTMKVYHKL